MDETELPILGTEPLVVEFANTLYDTQDFLGTPKLATLWFTTIGIPPIGDTAAARSLRDSIHALFTAMITAATPPEKAIAHINETAAAAPVSSRLIWHATGGFTAGQHPAVTGDHATLSRLAQACIELLTDDRTRLLRRCESPGCCMIFVQHHRRRRYCHESCAHRDRQARYYRRRVS